ncbi:hypothetical protein Clacol_002519 [Clathrus columnatus]|uniref:Uncharacterized protein n=1 Tax=Clathrus columnatus TaxID=1419009 RepID=A0AAV5A6P3_9AGAM|nr:hypothetical protein Clacol_002519 [Clathrus columnatus]
MKTSRTAKYNETVDSNTKIFNDMIKRLDSTDQSKVFLDVVCTLEAWLRVDKAYYSQARPMIVTLLETAMMFLSRLFNLKDGAHIDIPQCPPETQSQLFAYVKLLLTVKQYEYFFREDDGLQERLSNVLNTIWFNNKPQPVAFQSRYPTTSSSSTSVGLINTPESRAESMVDNNSPTSLSPSYKQPESPEQVSKQAGMKPSFIVQSQPTDTTISRVVNQSEPTPNSHGPSSHPATSLQITPRVVTSTSPNVLSSTKTTSKVNRLLSLAKVDKEGWKKGKASRTPETDLLKEQSIRERSIETQTESLPPSPITPKVVVSRQTEQKSLWNSNPAKISSSVREIDRIGINSTSIEKVPVFVPPTRVIIHEPRETALTAVIPESPLEDASTSGSVSQKTLGHSTDAPAQVIGPQYVPEISVVGSAASDLCSLQNETSEYFPQHEGPCDDTQMTNTPNEQTTVSRPRRLFNFSGAEATRLIDSSKHFLLRSKNELQPVIASQVATRFVDALQDFISVKHATVKTLFKPDTCINTPPASDKSSKVDLFPLKRARSSTTDGGMPSPVRRKLDLAKIIPDDIEDERRKFIRPLSLANQSQPFCHPDTPYETICVLAGLDGPFNENSSFEIGDEQYIRARRWADRYSLFDKSLPSLSFTLTCTVIPDLAAYPEEKTGEDVLCSLPIEWPQDGGLYITVQTDNTPPTSLAIAPPFWMRNSGPIDLTAYIGLKTTITFTSDRGFSKYVFALRLHPPTDSQLLEFHHASSLLSSPSDPSPDPWIETLSPVRSFLAELSL